MMREIQRVLFGFSSLHYIYKVFRIFLFVKGPMPKRVHCKKVSASKIKCHRRKVMIKSLTTVVCTFILDTLCIYNFFHTVSSKIFEHLVMLDGEAFQRIRSNLMFIGANAALLGTENLQSELILYQS